MYLVSSTLYYPVIFTIAATSTVDIYFGDIGYGFNIFTRIGGANIRITTISQSNFLNKWTHVALVRKSGVGTLFLDGNPCAPFAANYNVGTTGGTCYIGRHSSGAFYWKGYIDEFRITKGVARYVEPFNITSPYDYVFFNSLRHNVDTPLLTCNPGKNDGATSVSPLQDSQDLIYLDQEDGGEMFITGQVTYNGQPASRRVSLFTLRGKRLVREWWSDPVTGNYRFDNLKNQEYFVWSEDYQRVFDPDTHLTANQQ